MRLFFQLETVEGRKMIINSDYIASIFPHSDGSDSDVRILMLDGDTWDVKGSIDEWRVFLGKNTEVKDFIWRK